jgi:hypothetical protein
MPGVLPLPFDQDSDAKNRHYCMMIGTHHNEVAAHCQAGTNGPRRPLRGWGQAMRIFDSLLKSRARSSSGSDAERRIG